MFTAQLKFGNRPNTVSESTVSNTELSELFALGSHICITILLRKY